MRECLSYDLNDNGDFAILRSDSDQHKPDFGISAGLIASSTLDKSRIHWNTFERNPITSAIDDRVALVAFDLVPRIPLLECIQSRQVRFAHAANIVYNAIAKLMMTENARMGVQLGQESLPDSPLKDRHHQCQSHAVPDDNRRNDDE